MRIPQEIFVKMEKEKAEVLIKSGNVELFKRPKPLKKQNATKK